MSNVAPIAACCCMCSLVCLLIILLTSVATVEPVEYGIKYNSLTKNIDEEVMKGGWYLIGPTKKFITYPATLVNIDFTDYPGAQRGPFEGKDSGG